MFSLLPVLLFHPFILYIFQMGIKIRVGSCAMIYKKVLQLSKSTTFDGVNGQVINLLSNDVGKLDLALCFVHDLWKGPLEAMLMLYFIYREIGLASVVGMVFMFSFIPLQAWVGKMAATYRLRTAKRTDKRVRFMDEIIQGIQVIKMYTWENSFATMVDKVRRKETNAIRGSLFVQATLISFQIISKLAVFLSIVAFVYIDDKEVTARRVFVVSSFYAALHHDFVRFWAMAITTCAEGVISMSRITKFLLTNEPRWAGNDRKDEQTDPDRPKIVLTGIVREEKKGQEETEVIDLLPRRNITNESKAPKCVRVQSVCASWNNDDVQSSFRMKNIDLESTDRGLCCIVGPVGSGKSTVLNMIIGELGILEGTIHINGNLSYAAQEPWLFEGSIRQNIVFVEEFDEKRYYEVIKVCALDRDISMFPYGDLTIVGERGVCLSGGQKARINLARAVYKHADIYLLDDPLSAVDTHVGKHIFEQCLRDYLSDKIVFLVTHQLKVLKDVEHVVVMNAGRIDAQGSYKETHKNIYLRSLLSEIEEAEKGDKKFARLTSHVEVARSTEEPEEEHEVNSIGSVKFETYKAYFKSVKSSAFLTFTFLLFIISQIALTCTDLFLAKWVSWEEASGANKTPAMKSFAKEVLENTDNLTMLATADPSSDPSVDAQRSEFIIIYSVLIGITTWLVIHKSFAFFKLTLRASIHLHDSLFRGIIRATMSFFNSNPSGRILNRFSKDIGSIDTQLPMNIIDVLIVSFNPGRQGIYY